MSGHPNDPPIVVTEIDICGNPRCGPCQTRILRKLLHDLLAAEPAEKGDPPAAVAACYTLLLAAAIEARNAVPPMRPQDFLAAALPAYEAAAEVQTHEAEDESRHHSKH